MYNVRARTAYEQRGRVLSEGTGICVLSTKGDGCLVMISEGEGYDACVTSNTRYACVRINNPDVRVCDELYSSRACEGNKGRGAKEKTK